MAVWDYITDVRNRQLALILAADIFGVANAPRVADGRSYPITMTGGEDRPLSGFPYLVSEFGDGTDEGWADQSDAARATLDLGEDDPEREVEVTQDYVWRIVHADANTERNTPIPRRLIEAVKVGGRQLANPLAVPPADPFPFVKWYGPIRIARTLEWLHLGVREVHRVTIPVAMTIYAREFNP